MCFSLLTWFQKLNLLLFSGPIVYLISEASDKLVVLLMSFGRIPVAKSSAPERARHPRGFGDVTRYQIIPKGSGGDACESVRKHRPTLCFNYLICNNRRKGNHIGFCRAHMWKRETRKKLLQSFCAATKAAQCVKIGSSTIFKYEVSWLSAALQKIYIYQKYLHTLCWLQFAMCPKSALHLQLTHLLLSVCSSNQSHVTQKCTSGKLDVICCCGFGHLSPSCRLFLLWSVAQLEKCGSDPTEERAAKCT